MIPAFASSAWSSARSISNWAWRDDVETGVEVNTILLVAAGGVDVVVTGAGV